MCHRRSSSPWDWFPGALSAPAVGFVVIALITVILKKRIGKLGTCSMKKIFVFMAFAILLSCAKEAGQPELVEQPAARQEQTYTLSVTADKAASTKALYIEDGALRATWAEGETVQVIKPGTGEVIGTLTAQNNGPSTTLSGTVSGTFAVGNTLRLEFLNADHYTSQNGILHEGAGSLDKTCDYATAEVKILSIVGNTITTESASFRNRQAIMKFTLQHNSSPLVVSQMSITVTGESQSITISVVPPSPTDELYVAIPCYYDSVFSFSFDALDVLGKTHYNKNIDSQTIENGKFYNVTLNL